MKYIISLKHTCKKDPFITFWRQNANGYCYRRDWVGKYEDNLIQANQDYYNDKDTFAVDSEIVDKLWTKCQLLYGGEIIEAILNTTVNLKMLNLSSKQFLATDITISDKFNVLELQLSDTNAIITAMSHDYLIGYIDATIFWKNQQGVPRLEMGEHQIKMSENNEVLGPVYMDITCSCGNYVAFKSPSDIPKKSLLCGLCQKTYLIKYHS